MFLSSSVCLADPVAAEGKGNGPLRLALERSGAVPSARSSFPVEMGSRSTPCLTNILPRFFYRPEKMAFFSSRVRALFILVLVLPLCSGE